MILVTLLRIGFVFVLQLFDFVVRSDEYACCVVLADRVDDLFRQVALRVKLLGTELESRSIFVKAIRHTR